MSAYRKIIKSGENIYIFRALYKIKPSAIGLITVHPQMDDLMKQSFFVYNRPLFGSDQIEHVIVYFNNIILIMHFVLLYVDRVIEKVPKQVD